MAHARSRVDGGGALPSCCAQPGEQIFDIPDLSRGGRGPKSVVSPSPCPNWLSASGVGTSGQARVGGSERGSRAGTHRNTPRGSAGRWKPLEELSTSHSLQAAVSRCESLPTQAPQPLSFKWGRTVVWVQWARSRRPLPPRALSLSEGPDAAPCFS